jgi:hypothetical protein
VCPGGVICVGNSMQYDDGSVPLRRIVVTSKPPAGIQTLGDTHDDLFLSVFGETAIIDGVGLW